jgi:transcriptional regulator with XRE-family HTH domain
MILNRLRDVMKAKGMRLEEVAAAAKVSSGTVQNARSGNNINTSTAHCIADALGVSVLELTAGGPDDSTTAN